MRTDFRRHVVALTRQEICNESEIDAAWVVVSSNIRQRAWLWLPFRLLFLLWITQPILARSQTTQSQQLLPEARVAEPATVLGQLRNPACPFATATSFSHLTSPDSEVQPDCIRFGVKSLLAPIDESSSDGPGGSSSEAIRTSTKASGKGLTRLRTSDEQPIEWGALLVDSTRFLLFQQAFRLATEGDTRAGLSGPFFRDYRDAVLNIHGWNDGDPFFVNYIDHPMEGSAAAFLEVAHDPRYRNLEFSNTSAYWNSRLRATAFSAAFSLQFEIGPLSEASIGNIQKVPIKTGVVDWVVTPVVGLGWMVGEDALDKYLIKRWESHTNNHVARILIRGVFNPSRSFANMMGGKVPWHRDSRPGVREF